MLLTLQTTLLLPDYCQMLLHALHADRAEYVMPSRFQVALITAITLSVKVTWMPAGAAGFAPCLDIC